MYEKGERAQMGHCQAVQCLQRIFWAEVDVEPLEDSGSADFDCDSGGRRRWQRRRRKRR